MRSHPERFFLLVVFSLACMSAGLPVWAQSGQRAELAQSISRQYGLTETGAGLMGIRGGRGSIREAGGVVTLARSGLHGSLNPDQPASYAIRNGNAELYRGAQDQALAVGENFYVHSVYVGSDVVVLGLLSTRVAQTPNGSGRFWLSLSFFFPRETLDAGDTNSIFRAMDAWLRRGNQGPQAFPPQFSAGQAAAMAPAAEPAELTPGMSRAEVEETLGPPYRQVSFADRTWLTYPGMVVLFEGGKLASVEDPNQARAQVGVTSDPAGADIYLDGQFVGSTPANLSLQAGPHKISLRHPGYEPWEKELLAVAGSQLNLSPALKKLPPRSSQ